MRKRFPTLAATVAAGLLLAACGSGGSDATGAPASGTGGPSGEITVLTNRTDIVDSVFTEKYVPAFNAEYPDVKVKFEAITDYEGEVRIRMNTKNYGDVLLIPNSITADMLPTFFEPLGSVDELGQKYRFVTEQAFQGQVYGLAITGNAQGLVYNKKVFEAAGVTSVPTTPDAFVAALQAVKAKTDAVPLYTNYAAGWPLTQWEGNRGSVSADPDAVNKLATLDAPWAAGEERNVIDSLLYRVVKEGLTEEDPTTTDWEQSKVLLGEGKIATMVLGSWSIVQMQEKAANAADIGYMPFPAAKDGVSYSTIGGDYKNAVNKNSENKEAARAWVDWFANASNYAFDQGGIPPLKDAALPSQYDGFTELGVKFVEINPAPAGQEGLVQRIDSAAEIGLFEPTYRQRIVDAARGATDESLDAIFADLNGKWAAARAETQ